MKRSAVAVHKTDLRGALFFAHDIADRIGFKGIDHVLTHS